MIGALFALAQVVSAAAQTLIFNQCDTVQTPEGRTGKVESFKNGEMTKVRLSESANDTQYLTVKDFKKVEPPKPVRNEPQETFRVGDAVVNKPDQQGRIDSINSDTAIVRYGVDKYNVNTVDTINKNSKNFKENYEKSNAKIFCGDLRNRFNRFNDGFAGARRSAVYASGKRKSRRRDEVFKKSLCR